MLLSTALVATSFPAVASIAGALDSAVLAALRFALATLLFLPLVALRHGREAWPSWRSSGRYALLSAPLVGFFVGMFEALRTTTAVNTGALFTFAPGIAALFSRVLLGERLPGRRVLALTLGSLGAVWVVTRGDLGRAAELDLVRGDAYFLAGTASLGLYATLVKRLHRGEPPEVMTFWTLATGAAALLLLSWGELDAVRWRALEPRVLAVVAYLAVFTTLCTFLLSQSATVVLGPTRTMAYTFLNPALVAGLAWALGGGAVGWASAPGVGMTLAAVVLLQRGDGPALATLRAGARSPAGARRRLVPSPSRPSPVERSACSRA